VVLVAGLLLLAMVAIVAIPVAIAIGLVIFGRRRDVFAAVAVPLRVALVVALCVGLLIIPMGLIVGTATSYLVTTGSTLIVLAAICGLVLIQRKLERGTASLDSPKSWVVHDSFG
jgi:hypothetical protein